MWTVCFAVRSVVRYVASAHVPVQVLHHTVSGTGHVTRRRPSGPGWHRKDGDDKRHGTMSRQVCRRLQLLRPDGLSRSWTNLQRSAELVVSVLLPQCVYDCVNLGEDQEK